MNCLLCGVNSVEVRDTVTLFIMQGAAVPAKYPAHLCRVCATLFDMDDSMKQKVGRMACTAAMGQKWTNTDTTGYPGFHV